MSGVAIYNRSYQMSTDGVLSAEEAASSTTAEHANTCAPAARNDDGQCAPERHHTGGECVGNAELLLTGGANYADVVNGALDANGAAAVFPRQAQESQKFLKSDVGVAIRVVPPADTGSHRHPPSHPQDRRPRPQNRPDYGRQEQRSVQRQGDQRHGERRHDGRQRTGPREAPVRPQSVPVQVRSDSVPRVFDRPTSAVHFPRPALPAVDILKIVLNREVQAVYDAECVDEEQRLRFEAIQEQVAFYMSVRNLPDDMYLRSLMDNDGWIPLLKMSEFRRLRSLIKDCRELVVALAREQRVEVRFDKCLVRPRTHWQRYPLDVENRVNVPAQYFRSAEEVVGVSVDRSGLHFDVQAYLETDPVVQFDQE